MDSQLESNYKKGLVNGDHHSFDQLFIHYHPRVMLFLTGFIKDPDQAKDLAQEAFLRLWTNRAQLALVDSLGGYLFRMLRNMVYDHFRYMLRHNKFQDNQQEAVTYCNVVEEEYCSKELEFIIDLLVRNMPAQRNRIFTMSRHHGLTNEEIAQQLNISKRTVENQISQALSEIRRVVTSALSILL